MVCIWKSNGSAAFKDVLLITWRASNYHGMWLIIPFFTPYNLKHVFNSCDIDVINK